MSTEKENGKPPKYVSGFSPKDIETRVVKCFLDILILIEMKKQSNLSGYDLTAFVNSKFGGILSPGTVYATIYTMERKGIIKGESDGRKTVYQLTPQGELLITGMMKEFHSHMSEFVGKFLML